MKMLLIAILCIGLPTSGFGQDTKPLTENSETHYYDFWPGTWYRVVNGKTDTTSTCFKEYFERDNHDGENSAMTNTDFTLVHITLAVTNMPAMKKFYDTVFGASLQALPMYGTTLYQGKLGGISLLLCPNEIARAKAEQNRHQLRFTVNDIAATMRSALANGATLLNEISDHEGAKIASVRDPDGNSIEFVQMKN